MTITAEVRTGSATHDRTPAPTDHIILEGTGVLADAIAAQVLPRAVALDVTAGATWPTPLLITATDGWDAGSACNRARAVELDAAWLPVRGEVHSVVIGPLEVRGRPGCTDCAQARRRRARPDSAGRDAVLEEHREQLAALVPPLLTPLAADTVAALVAKEIETIAVGGAALSENSVLIVHLGDLAVRRHSFVPEPLCPTCGHLPQDSAEDAVIHLTPQPKLAPDMYRGRRVQDDLDALRGTFVDGEVGVIREIVRGVQAGMVVSAAPMRLRGDHAEESGVGRTRSYRSSELVAILESLERYGGVQPGGKRTTVEGSYEELAPHALDPRSFGTHPESSYAAADFPFRPFTPQARCRWVWGYSFARSAPVLVPETMAYYHLHGHGELDRPFLYEISNGCSLGSSLEEAILHGILEAAERDAFLMTWYAQLPVPRIDLDSARDRAIPMQAKAIELETGMEVMAFETTMEYGVPSVWALAVGPDQGPQSPRLVCAAGSSLDLERAVLNALSELGSIAVDLQRRFAGDATRAEAMVADPSLVLSMGDHSTLTAHRDAFHRLEFLMVSTRRRDLSHAPPTVFHGLDLTEDLRTVIAALGRAGLDVVVVDQTTPEHRLGGFHCVKVLVPGMIPMTFGHRNQRLEGLERLHTVPEVLGYRGDGRRAPINPNPHPFP